MRTRRFWVMGLAVVATLATLDLWLLAPRSGPRRTPEPSELMPGRWSFKPMSGVSTRDPILTRFRSRWGKPAGDDRVIAPGAWKARMEALHDLAKLGPKAVPILVKGLDDEDPEIRSLAVEGLRYLGDRTAVDRLGRSLREDPSAEVRIQAAVDLASIQGSLPKSLAQEITAHEPSRMVRERLDLIEKFQPVTEKTEIRNTLATFDIGSMGSAAVGLPAPDFTLKDLQGRSYNLSSYKGKKAIVLVFIYGATCMQCTGQLANFRTRLPDFEKAGAQVLLVEANDANRVRRTLQDAGVSVDPRLPLLMDPVHVVAAKYGVAMQMNHIEWLNRPSTFVIDRSGVIRRSFLATAPADRPSPDEILDSLASLGRTTNATGSSVPKLVLDPTAPRAGHESRHSDSSL